MQMINIQLSAQEAQVLINLLNIACQAKGLEAAESCTYFAGKIQKAVRERPNPAAIRGIQKGLEERISSQHEAAGEAKQEIEVPPQQEEA